MNRKDAPKVFYDVILDYQTLKFIYEYGFTWDDKITRILLNKTSQKPRELGRLLSNVSESTACVLWSEDIVGKSSKSQRKLIHPNIYHFAETPWFLGMYACCGMNDSFLASCQIKKCRKKQWAYPNCRDETEQDCPYQRVCENENRIRLFKKMSAEGVKKEEKKEAETCLELISQYSDIVRENRFRYYFGPNEWTETAAVKSPANPDGVFRDAAEYQRFLEMVGFFTRFAPLSVLGDSFLRRLGGEIPKLPAFIRNLPPAFGLEQEYIYRVLYAMSHGMNIAYEGEDYQPIRLGYWERGLDGLTENLYLLARPLNGSQNVRLPLRDGAYLAPKKGKAPPPLPSVPLTEGRLFEVTFYNHPDAAYLDERRELWREMQVGGVQPVGKAAFLSPYYPDRTQWQVNHATYRVAPEDLPGFALFVRSFGDFASCPGLEGVPITRDVARSLKSKGEIKEYQSLLSLYRSNALLEGCAGNALPPRKEELSWLRFVLEAYPNFCSLFLPDSTIGRIRERLAQSGAESLPSGWFDCSSRVRDIPSQTAQKYHKIFDAVGEHRILRYEFHAQVVEIYPYALEYDVCRHLSGQAREPVSVMCYSLCEKRNLIISYKDIRVGQGGAGQAEYHFSEPDKLYHVLAYVLRCASEGKECIESRKCSKGKECIWSKTEKLMERLSLAGSRKNHWLSAEMRRMQPPGAADYRALYANAHQAAEKDEEARRFLERVFGYWADEPDRPYTDPEAPEACFRRKYQLLLLKYVSEALQRERAPLRLAEITDEEIWQLICGALPCGNGPLNEIAFFNERFLTERVSFLLEEADAAIIDTVYRLFRNYLCTGEVMADGRIRFTVRYEAFHYRRIHMALMALGSHILCIEPPETAKIIQERRKNKNTGGNVHD